MWKKITIIIESFVSFVHNFIRFPSSYPAPPTLTANTYCHRPPFICHLYFICPALSFSCPICPTRHSPLLVLLCVFFFFVFCFCNKFFIPCSFTQFDDFFDFFLNSSWPCFVFTLHNYKNLHKQGCICMC